MARLRPGWLQLWEKSRMNFKTCLCFGCDQQSQRGLCVLLCEQAQKEGANAAPHSPLPCCSVAEGRALGTPLPPCRGPGSAPNTAVLEEVETGAVHSAGRPAAAVPRCLARCRRAACPRVLPECPGQRAWGHPHVWAPGAASGTRTRMEMVAKHHVFGLCPLSLF